MTQPCLLAVIGALSVHWGSGGTMAAACATLAAPGTTPPEAGLGARDPISHLLPLLTFPAPKAVQTAHWHSWTAFPSLHPLVGKEKP